MTYSWKLHTIIFWAAILVVCAFALVAGWHATSVLTDEETTYLLYEPAFLILLVVLGLLFVIGSLQIGKVEKKMYEIENDLIKWSVERGWKKPAIDDEFRDWIKEEAGKEETGIRASQLLGVYELYSDSKKNAWKLLLGPVLQLLFLVTIASAAIPSAYWFLQVNPNINVMTAIVVLGGGIVASIYTISSLFLIYPKVKEDD